jgi:CDP-diacylglycerol--serine O-phosphatidyltransferase
MMRLSRSPRRTAPPNLRMLPNALTTLALCAGMNAIRYAVQGRWEASVIAIAVASVLDGLDGATARLLGAQSKFGAELDSLSDVVCFGVAPAILLYLWSLHDGGNFGWVATLSFGICAALRLARFNASQVSTGVRQAKAPYFVGVPTPAGAGVALLPLIADFEIGPTLVGHPYVTALWTIGTALLMVSRIPTPSLNAIHIRPQLRVPLLAVIGISAGAAVDIPWATLLALGAMYLISLPILAWRRQRNRGAIQPSVLSEENDSEELAGYGHGTAEAASDLFRPIEPVARPTVHHDAVAAAAPGRGSFAADALRDNPGLELPARRPPSP